MSFIIAVRLPWLYATLYVAQQVFLDTIRIFV